MKKKSIYLAIGVSILLITSFIFIKFIFKDPYDAKESLNTYVELLNKKNYESMYEMISNDSKSKISKKNFIARNKNIYEGIEGRNFKVNIIGKTDDVEEVPVSFEMSMDTVAGRLNFIDTVMMKKEEDKKQYSIVWNSNVIFPDLDYDNKIRVGKLKSTRGNILDRNGTALAMEGTVSEVGVIPMKLGDNKEENLMKISEILKISVDDVNKKLSASYVKEDMFIPLKVISRNDNRKEFLLTIPGVMVNSKYGREYPLGQGAAHLTGYVQPINAEELKKFKNDGYSENSIIGKSGLEKIYEKKLRGN